MRQSSRSYREENVIKIYRTFLSQNPFRKTLKLFAINSLREFKYLENSTILPWEKHTSIVIKIV